MIFFRNKLVERAYQIRLLRSIWRILPQKARFRIYQRFSLFIAEDVEKLTDALIDILENEPCLVSGIEKKDEILKFLKKNKLAAMSPEFPEIWLQKDSGADPVFNFNGAIFPYLSGEAAQKTFMSLFFDTFLFSLLFNDDYSAALVTRLESLMFEGPYGYTEENFDITVKPGDTVIDAGAWAGDFSAYASSRGAFVYAFEPTLDTFKILQKTAELNNKSGGGGGIYPVNKGLGGADGEVELFIFDNSAANSTVVKDCAKAGGGFGKIKLTALDNFVHEQNLEKVDFIKADIEGAERDMLKGARGVLKEFAPKLALCTYHLPDDPETLESLIKDANPNYRVVHISKKLFAAAN